MNFTLVGQLFNQGFTAEQVEKIMGVMDTNTNTGTGTNTNTGTVQTPTPTPTPTPTQTPPTAANIPTSTPADNSGNTLNNPPVPTGSAAGNPDVKPAIPNNPPQEGETVQLLREMLGIIQKGAINGLGNNPPAAADGSEILATILNPVKPH